MKSPSYKYMQKLSYSGIRGSIAQYVRFATRFFRPFFSIEVNAHRLVEFRSQHKDITYTPILLKIIATAAEKYPIMNGILARPFLRKKIYVPGEVDISIAMEKNYKGETFVAIPIVRSVNEKSIKTIASEINYLSNLPYEKLPDIKPVLFFHKLPDFWKYWSLKFICRSPRVFKLFFGTIGFSNLGKFGITIASPTWVNNIVFGIGTIEEKPIVINGEIEKAPILHITMGFNHAVIDGAMAGRILSEVKGLIENSDYSSL